MIKNNYDFDAFIIAQVNLPNGDIVFYYETLDRRRDAEGMYRDLVAVWRIKNLKVGDQNASPYGEDPYCIPREFVTAGNGAKYIVTFPTCPS